MPQQKLELTWVGKDQRPKLEPRILLEDPELSYHAKHRFGPNDQFDNRLIFGDNLLALKALEQEFTGKVKCIYIDPPYNTGSAFEHYDDGLEHSQWLNLMRPRLELLRNLLRDDGSIWISIDDNECHYLKVLCDEVFGRRNFVANVIWQKKYSPQNDAKWLSDNHDHILIFAKLKDVWRPNLLPRSGEMNDRYKNLDNDERGPWKATDFSVKTYTPNCDYPIVTPSGRVVNPPPSRCWVVNEKRFQELVEDNRIWFGKDGGNVPSVKKFLSEVKDGSVSLTIWTYEEVGHNQDAKKEVKEFNNLEPFGTPKPEKLIERILTLATNPNDLVLDSFLGSGTTAAVAHKMGRRWIGIELGDHAFTHCQPRLVKVVDGEQGGISKSVNWQGGGGFRYFKLAPTLLTEDKWGNLVINPEYNAEMLAEALCKLEGFRYQPSPEHYWQQGQSTENDFIYTTTQILSQSQLEQLSEEVGPDRTLLVLCNAFKGSAQHLLKLTVKKIPKHILDKCEWGKSDYSLQIQNLPDAPPKNGQFGLNFENPDPVKQ